MSMLNALRYQSLIDEHPDRSAVKKALGAPQYVCHGALQVQVFAATTLGSASSHNGLTCLRTSLWSPTATPSVS